MTDKWPSDPDELFALRTILGASRAVGVDPVTFIGPCRRRELAWARQDAMRKIRETTGMSYPKLGELFGNRDHTTVIHGIKASKEREEYYAQINSVR